MKPSPRRGPRRALLGVLSIAFVLLPATGIAYLGAVSYRDDRGLVAAKLDEQFRAAVTLAASLEVELTRTLDAVAGTLVSARPTPADLAALRQQYSLAALPFRIGRDGRLEYPAPEPLRRRGPATSDFLSRAPRTCPERGFDTCIRALRTARRRAGQLDEARRHELGACAASSEPCEVRPRELDMAKRAYGNLARFDDTGPDALVGLGRLALRTGDRAAAMRHYQALAARFDRRLDDDGVSYGLIAELGLAEAQDSLAAWLAMYRALLARTYEAPSPMLEQLADELRARIGAASLDPGSAAELAALDARLAGSRDQTSFAAALTGEVDELSRTAGPQARGRPALAVPERTVIYRREADGAVIGVIADMAMLQRQAGAGVDLSHLAPGTRAVIESPGDSARRAARTRTLASTGFGPLVPHLSLALVNDRSMPDPLDEIIEARGRRHVAITGGLVALLMLGLLATIRGAARERELARLKSDFVSTVSHELKTPLTSIRMFGEMLQQGVAGDDRQREARYHEIIVKESQRLGLLIANLLDYSQIERGTRRYSRKPELAADLARDAVATFQRFRDAPVDIRVDMADEVAEAAEILVDREVVVQSLLNLLSNAVKYGEPPIDVIVKARPDQVVLAVRDRGPGIAATEQERIFREFYRTPAAYSSGVEGTGLGLALVKRHVEAQDGQVEVSSEPGRGATFSLRLPRCA
jgi:signal transduction histidine kinase